MELSEFGKNNGKPDDDLTPEEQYAKGQCVFLWGGIPSDGHCEVHVKVRALQRIV